MTDDAKSLNRYGQVLVVEVKRAHGSPPDFDTDWSPLWNAKVDRVEINRDGRPSTATIWFPDLRWEQTRSLLCGDAVRIRTNHRTESNRTVLLSGFVTAYLSDFSGGSEKPKTTFERNAIVVSDHRWLLAATSPVFGQDARGPDDYDDYGLDTQSPIDNSSTYLTGQRAIFNRDGRPNRNPVLLTVLDSAGVQLCQVPIFANPDQAVPWSARDMVRYLLAPTLNNAAYKYLPIDDPLLLTGLDHSDFDKVLNHVVAEGLNVVEAVQTICRQLGFGFREDYDNNGDVNLVFYKIAAASQWSRDSANPTVLQHLHAPPAGENISVPIAAGKKMLWSMSLAEDIKSIVNDPWCLGSPHRFEFTAELCPAWDDTDLVPDTSEANANLFFTDARLQDLEDKNAKDFHKYYHPRGSAFRHDVGRKWCLNESGAYSGSGPYDRGMPFDFGTVLPDEHIRNAQNYRLFAPFNRCLLPCLTVDKDQLSSIGVRVEFSFDGGDTWQVVPAAIASLDDECGIYITEANLAEMVEGSESLISGGDLDGIQLNYWTSLCDDIINSRIFKTGGWHTRVRVTASVQMDQRLRRLPEPTSIHGSPFWHSHIYDFSKKHGLELRTASSIFSDGDLSARELDSTAYLEKDLEAIREANEDRSISGRFTLDRLWLGDGSGVPAFALGDCIEKITGRDYPLSSVFGSRTVYPEIVQIVYLPETQKTVLITRDLRFAEVNL